MFACPPAMLAAAIISKSVEFNPSSALAAGIGVSQTRVDAVGAAPIIKRAG